MWWLPILYLKTFIWIVFRCNFNLIFGICFCLWIILAVTMSDLGCFYLKELLLIVDSFSTRFEFAYAVLVEINCMLMFFAKFN